MIKKLTGYWVQRSIERDRLPIQQHFCKQMVLLLMCGLTTSHALTQTVSLTTPTRWVNLLAAIDRHVKSGQSLADSLRLYPYCFDALLITLIHSGEQANRLESNLNLWLQWTRWKLHWMNRLKRAFAYPCLTLVLVLIALSTATLLVLPTVLALTPDPAPYLMVLLSIQALPLNVSLTVLFCIALIGFVARHKLRSALMNVAFHLPWLRRVLQHWQLAHFFYLINTLSASNIRFDLQLKMACNLLTHRQLQQQWQSIRQRLLNGEPITQVVNQKDLPPIIRHLLYALNHQHNQSMIWSQLALYFEQQIEWFIQRIDPLIEPLITLITGVLVVIFIVLFLLPLYQ